MTPEQKERHEYLYDILAKMENNFEANFYEIFGLLKAYIKAEIEMIKAQEKMARENPMADLN
jgi:hypothetical protein